MRKEQTAHGVPASNSFASPFNIPDNFAQLADTITDDDAGIAVHLASPNSIITVPLTASSGYARRERSGCCAINIDIARRDSCFLEAGSVSARTVCSRPRLLNVRITAGEAISDVVTLKSRFSLEFTQAEVSSLRCPHSRLLPSTP